MRLMSFGSTVPADCNFPSHSNVGEHTLCARLEPPSTRGGALRPSLTAARPRAASWCWPVAQLIEIAIAAAGVPMVIVIRAAVPGRAGAGRPDGF
jgi:hypothetical protein